MVRFQKTEHSFKKIKRFIKKLCFKIAKKNEK